MGMVNVQRCAAAAGCRLQAVFVCWMVVVEEGTVSGQTVFLSEFPAKSRFNGTAELVNNLHTDSET